MKNKRKRFIKTFVTQKYHSKKMGPKFCCKKTETEKIFIFSKWNMLRKKVFFYRILRKFRNKAFEKYRQP